MDFEKKDAEATRRWVQVPKAVELAREGDSMRKEAKAALAESRARIVELSVAVGQPPPPTQLQSAVAAAEQLRQQLSGLPDQDADAIGGVANLLATLQATVAAAAGDAPMGDGARSTDVPAPPQPVEPHGAAVPSGNAVPVVAVTEGDTPSPTTPTEPTRAADPAGDAAPAATTTCESVPQTAAISATQADTELVAQANVLSQAVQYDAPQLVEARAALGAMLAYPPLDFDAVRCGVQTVQEAMAKQAEADDVPPQAKNRRPAAEGGEDGGDTDDL